jgi:hypothetical protein
MTHRTPRWVKMFGIVALVLALLIVIIVLFGIGGPHGRPHQLYGRHGIENDNSQSQSSRSEKLISNSRGWWTDSLARDYDLVSI